MLLLLPLAYADEVPVRQTSTIFTLYNRGVVPSQLADVWEVHGCAGENAFINVSETDKRLLVRVTEIQEGSESTIFEVTHEPSAYPTGFIYSYYLPREGEYALTVIYFAELTKRKTFTVDCTYSADDEDGLPEPPPSPSPGGGTGDVGEPETTLEDALDAAEAANEALAAAIAEGKNVTAVQDTLVEAQLALNTGNYALAVQLFNEAVELAADAPMTEEPDVIPPEEAELENDAYNAIADAVYAINVSKHGGADVSKAEEKLEEARDAYSNGNYALALTFAEEATELAENALNPPAEPEEPAGDGGWLSFLPSISMPSLDLSMLLPLIVIIIVVAGAAYIYKKWKEQPPKEEVISPEQLPSSMRDKAPPPPKPPSSSS